MLGSNTEKGLVELAADDIFKFITENTQLNFILRASFVEIYQEGVKDLLTPGNNVQIREDRIKGVYYEASETLVSDLKSIKGLIQNGKRIAFYFFGFRN